MIENVKNTKRIKKQLKKLRCKSFDQPLRNNGFTRNMKVTIVSQSGRPLVADLVIPDKSTYDDLRKAYQQKKGLSTFRQQYYLQTADKKRGDALKHGPIDDKVSYKEYDSHSIYR
jgi:hypothetical protein